MDYFVLSLPEAISTYLGLALQMVLRQSILPGAVGVLIAVNCIRLFVQEQGHATPLRPAITYFFTSLGLVCLFWPDILPFGRGRLRAVTASQVASYAASRDPTAELRTAEDAKTLPLSLPDALTSPIREVERVIEPWGFRAMLGIATEQPLKLARLISSQTYRPLASLVPMQWLMGMSLTADLSRALSDWLEGCYKPSLLTDREFQEAITAQQLLPWGNTPVAQALASREASPGAQTGKGYFRTPTPLGVSFLSNPGSTNMVRCDVYLAAVEMDVQRSLFTTTSPGGTPLSQVFQQEFGLDVQTQARLILFREMLTLMKQPVPGPSLAGAYATLTGVNAVAGAGRGIIGNLGHILTGALSGGGSAVTAQFQQVVERLLWWVAVAAWFVWSLPDIMGVIQFLLVGLFPLVFLWALWPGQQVRALLFYFVTLVWAYGLPLWFAIIDVLARAAASRAPTLDDPILQVLNWAPQQVASVRITVIGLALVPVLTGALLFGVVRGTQVLWRSATSA